MASTDPDHQAEVGRLSAFMVELATRMIAERGVFHPFGGGIRAGGEIVHLDVTDIAEPGDAIARLAREIRAVAEVGIILVDARVEPPGANAPTDAIMLIVESHRGVSVRSFLPYARAASGQVTYGKHFDGPRSAPIIFV